MNQNRKYFGMTVAQIGVLGGLAGCAFLLFCVTGLLVLRNRSGSASQSVAPTSAPQSTATLTIPPTQTATITPTPIPYEQLIPAGWKQFKTGLVELWLPPNFVEANKSVLGDISNLAVPDLIITEAKSKSSLYNMLVVVSFEPLVGESLDAFLDGELAKIPQQARVADRRKVYVNSTEAVRLLFEIRVNSVDFNDLTYVFLDGGTVWYVEYFAEINEFYNMLPNFESSAKTFRVVK